VIATGGGLACEAGGTLASPPRWVACPARLLLAGAGAEPRVPGEVPGRVAATARRGVIDLPRRTRRVGRAVGFRGVAAAALRQGLGRVCQEAIWRPGAGVEVPGAVHAPGGVKQPAAAAPGRRPGGVRGQGLRGRGPATAGAAACRGVL